MQLHSFRGTVWVSTKCGPPPGQIRIEMNGSKEDIESVLLALDALSTCHCCRPSFDGCVSGGGHVRARLEALVDTVIWEKFFIDRSKDIGAPGASGYMPL